MNYAEEESPEERGSEEQERKMILILEDNPDIAYAMKMIFSHVFSDDCMVTSRTEDAYNVACSENPTLILSDLDLQGGDSGLNFLRKFKKLKPNCPAPVVVFTALSPQDKDFVEAGRLCDTIYEKGSVSLLQLCRNLFRLLN